MRVIIQRHIDVGMSHDVLYNVLGFIPAFANVVQNVWRKVCGVITFGNACFRFCCISLQAPGTYFIVDCHFWQAVPVKEQKLCVAL